jgi:UDP-glucose:(heptosyl)LPS alpha-1,3-glucosyltransferase
VTTKPPSPPVARPRIAVLAEKYGLAGGSERFVKEVTERLADTGRYEFHVFATQWVCTRTDIVFHRVPRLKFPRFLRPWSFAWLSQRMIAGKKFDLVHSHWPTFRADVFSTHGAPHAHWVSHVLKRRPTLFDRMMMSIDRRMIDGGARSTFMPVSGFLQQRFAEVFGDLPGSWRVVHPGVDVQRFGRDPSARAQVRRQHGIPDNAFVALFVGMNFETKGLERLMRGVAASAAGSPDEPIHLLVVGRGNIPRYRQLARELGIERFVTFAGAQKEGIERYYSAADVLAMLSSFETFCMAVLEGMAAGLPALITDRMGVRDLVRDGVEGHVLPSEADPATVAACLRRMREPATMARMSSAARSVALQHTWSRVAEAVDAAYIEAMARGRW